MVIKRSGDSRGEEPASYYKNLFEGIPLGALILNVKDGRIVKVNRAFAFMFGYPSEENVVGLSLYDIVESRDDAEKIFNDLKGKGFLKRLVAMVRRRDGTNFYASFSGAILNGDGTLAGMIVDDVTETVRMESEMLKSSKLESLGALARGIAHEFNNILTPLLGRISFLREKLPPEFKDQLDAMERLIQRASGLTKELLVFSRGEASIRKKPLKVQDVVHEAVAFALRGSNIKPVFSIPEDLPPVEGDRELIFQLINNIVINSRQAMPHGGYIKVKGEWGTYFSEKAHPPLSPGQYVKITISDQGCGMDAKTLERVFDPFFTTKDNSKGLGLTVCYFILKSHGGAIEIESEPGKGTDVHVYLPVYKGKEKLKEEAVERPEDVSKRRVLVVDDEEDIRSVCKEFLSSTGCLVDEAGDPLEALEMVKSSKRSGLPYDVVLLDLTMPGGPSSLKVLERIRELDPDVKVILMSGYSTDLLSMEQSNLGLCGVLQKPFSLKELDEVLRKCLSEGKE